MKVGGNSSLQEWFAKHPGSYSASSGNLKDKYTCSAAMKYLEELSRRSAEDIAKNGTGRVVVEGMQSGATTEEAKSPSRTKEEDFFNTWGKSKASPTNGTSAKPATPIALTPNSSRPTTPRVPSPALSSSSMTSSSNVAQHTPIVAVGEAPLTTSRTTSASIMKSGTATSGSLRTSKLGAQRTPAGASAGVAGKAKLGAKKANVTINFEEAERKAREEEERIKKLGYDSLKEAQEAEAAAARLATQQREQASTASTNRSAVSPSSSGFGATKPGHTRRESDTDRLGMGMKKLGFGQTMGMSGTDSAKQAEAARKAAERRAKGYDGQLSPQFLRCNTEFSFWRI